MINEFLGGWQTIAIAFSGNKFSFYLDSNTVTFLYSAHPFVLTNILLDSVAGIGLG